MKGEGANTGAATAAIDKHTQLLLLTTLLLLLLRRRREIRLDALPRRQARNPHAARLLKRHTLGQRRTPLLAHDDVLGRGAESRRLELAKHALARLEVRAGGGDDDARVVEAGDAGAAEGEEAGGEGELGELEVDGVEGGVRDADEGVVGGEGGGGAREGSGGVEG